MPLMNEKKCVKCGVTKPLEAFHRKYDKLTNRCKLCRCDDEKIRRERDPEHKARARHNNLVRMYGITGQQYQVMLGMQEGLCAICARACPTGKYLSVDHDHKCCPGQRSCGKCVRRLLCASCNSGMGHFRDDPELFRKAIDYIKVWNREVTK